MKAKLKLWTGWDSVRRLVRKLFCCHSWTLHSRDRYVVMRADGSKEGEVTLALFECKKCGKDNLIPSDRIHFPNSD